MRAAADIKKPRRREICAGGRLTPGP
ncbi:MAG: hypothetical protein H6Q33_3770, partial [Deltaproteobacteria bacterium]|nr:hypothetical protein [Deltaproteobacteria bacterium]